MFLSHSLNCEVFSRRRHIFKKTRKFFFYKSDNYHEEPKKKLETTFNFQHNFFYLEETFSSCWVCKKKWISFAHFKSLSLYTSFSTSFVFMFMLSLFSFPSFFIMKNDLTTRRYYKEKKMKIFFRLKCNFWKIFFFYLFLLSHTYTFTIFSIFKLHFS
jgi:hypothetical protein